jgi:hypothetical protein
MLFFIRCFRRKGAEYEASVAETKQFLTELRGIIQKMVSTNKESKNLQIVHSQVTTMSHVDVVFYFCNTPQEALQSKMATVSSQAEALAELERHRSLNSSFRDDDGILFHSWRVDEFGATSFLFHVQPFTKCSGIPSPFTFSDLSNDARAIMDYGQEVEEYLANFGKFLVSVIRS